MEHEELIDKLTDLICGIEEGRLRAELRGIIEDLEESPYEPPRFRPETDPKAQTNEEFLVHLLNFGCPTGALIQPFVMTALEDYSKRVISEPQVEVVNSFVAAGAWHRTAEHVKSQLDAKYKK